MGPRHICLVTETFPPEVNGVANTLANLSRELRMAGHKLTIVRPWQRGEPGTGHGGFDDEQHHRVRGWPLPGYPELRFGWPSRRRLRALWKKRRPEAVYIATQGPLGWIALSLARQMGIPTLSGFHTNFHQYSRYYGASFLEGVIRRYLVAFHNRCGATLAPTSTVCRELESWGIANVQCWSRGVDSRNFHPRHRSAALRAQWGLDERQLGVLYVGRLAAEKNLAQAISAFERLKVMHPGARFILVGDGPLRDRLQRAHPDYLFCGTRTGEALAQHYASADLFLFPSQSETFGNVVLEAMASGLGVVAFDHAAAHEHIQDGINGRKLAMDDSEGFSLAAMSLADQRTRLDKVRTQAREHAESLDWAVLARSFEQHLFRQPQETPENGAEQSYAGF